MVESVFQKAVIVQVELPKKRERSSSLKAFDEFKELVLSSGAEISDEDFSKQAKPTSGLFITKGKAERIKDSLEQTESELVIFNHDLTPSQERNLENIFQARVLDRTGLILDIFAERASSHIGKLQVYFFNVMRVNSSYEITLDEFSQQTDKDDFLNEMNNFYQKAILETPTQYFWMHRRFKTRPEGEEGFYPHWKRREARRERERNKKVKNLNP